MAQIDQQNQNENENEKKVAGLQGRFEFVTDPIRHDYLLLGLQIRSILRGRLINDEHAGKFDITGSMFKQFAKVVISKHDVEIVLQYIKDLGNHFLSEANRLISEIEKVAYDKEARTMALMKDELALPERDQSCDEDKKPVVVDEHRGPKGRSLF